MSNSQFRALLKRLMRKLIDDTCTAEETELIDQLIVWYEGFRAGLKAARRKPKKKRLRSLYHPVPNWRRKELANGSICLLPGLPQVPLGR